MGMDTVILGPGNLDQAHQPDEYIAVDRIAPTVEIIQGMVQRFCIAGEAS
jgi:acetylornithine deacetylase